MSVDRNDWNRRVIEEFHSRGGKVGGPFEGSDLLLLTTIGAKSGQQRVNPLVYLPDGDRLIIVASKGGAPTNPDWYYNVVAHPDVTVEVGTEKFLAHATIHTSGEEREQLYNHMAAKNPQFAEYQPKTTRKIPIIVLARS